MSDPKVRRYDPEEDDGAIFTVDATGAVTMFQGPAKRTASGARVRSCGADDIPFHPNCRCHTGPFVVHHIFDEPEAEAVHRIMSEINRTPVRERDPLYTKLAKTLKKQRRKKA